MCSSLRSVSMRILTHNIVTTFHNYRLSDRQDIPLDPISITDTSLLHPCPPILFVCFSVRLYSLLVLRGSSEHHFTARKKKKRAAVQHHFAFDANPNNGRTVITRCALIRVQYEQASANNLHHVIWRGNLDNKQPAPNKRTLQKTGSLTVHWRPSSVHSIP